MKFKISLPAAASSTTLLFLAQATTSCAAPATPHPNQPNIVLMVADDLTYHDIACFGSKDAHTPNLDKLASQGIKLTSCYTPAPVCSPTRQALYTGIFPVRSGAYPNHTHTNPGVKSMPMYLKPLGYRVGLVGKTHFGPPENFPFEYPAAAPGEDTGDEGTENALNYDAAEKFMDRDPDQPFALVVTPHEPHSPWNKGDAGVYDPAKLTLAPYLVDTPLTRRALHNYFGEVTELDRQVGVVMDAVQRTGQADNTIFVFVSEQGSSMPHGKWTLYDAGIRSASIVRWPGKIKAGSQSDALCQYVDYLPTFIQAAGGEPPTDIDGRSIMDVLLGKTDKARDYVYAEETSRGIIQGPEAYGIRAVADHNWKYIWNMNYDSEFKNTETNTPRYKSWVTKGETDPFAKEQADRYVKRPEVELYDLKADPYEMKNLAADPAQKATLTRMRIALDAWMTQQGDKGIQTEMEAKEHQGAGRAKSEAEMQRGTDAVAAPAPLPAGPKGRRRARAKG